MTKDCEAIAVHAASPVHRTGPVFYASLPREAEPREELGAQEKDVKRRLVSILWNHLAAIERHGQPCRLPSDSAAYPIHLFRDPLGKPLLRLGALQGPSISFSEGAGKIWAALSGDDSDVGIDAAGANEFQGKYPFRRVIDAQELQMALNLAGGDLQEASALLWSVKEAVVKALGCGFHLVDPIQIHVDPSLEEDRGGAHDGYAFSVRLSGKAAARFPIGVGWLLRVRSFRRINMWLSIAVLHRSFEGDADCRSNRRRSRD